MQLQLVVVQPEQVSAVFEREKKRMRCCDYHLNHHLPGLLKYEPESEMNGKRERINNRKL